MNSFHAYRLAAILAVSVLAGCGSGNQAGTLQEAGSGRSETTADPSPEPVKLTMYNHYNNISDERLRQFLIEPLQVKLPHITFEVVKHEKGSTIEELVAAGTFPDFYYGSNVGFPTYTGLQLQHDMRDLIQKHKFDWSRVDPVYTDAVRMFGEKDEVYGIPFSANVGIVDIHVLAVSSGSKNKDAAMEVLKVISSDEVQKLMSEYGTPSILKSDEIRKVYGSKLDEYKGKNVQALFKTTPGVPHAITKYDYLVSAEAEVGRRLITEGHDVNTVIRTIEEKANQKLSQQK